MHRSPVWFLILFCSLTAVSQTAPDPADHSYTVSASQPWTDTHLDFSASDTLSLTAQVAPGSDSTCTPQGTAACSSEPLPVASAPAGALIAKTSDNGAASLVGTSHELRAETGGHLFLGINQATKSDCTFNVSVKVTHSETSNAPARNVKDQLSSAAKVWLQGQFGGESAKNSQSSAAVAGNGTATATTSANSSGGIKLPAVLLDADLRGHIDELPRRVHDHAGNLGDMVNFVIVGSQDRAQAALQAADWHVADVDSKEAGLKAVLNTYEKKIT